MGKKNLEQLFKDTFRDFGEVPDERVWQAIEASLDDTKKRNRLLPIWWQLGGVAAAVAILLYVLAPFGTGTQGEGTPNFEAIPTITDVQDPGGPDPKTPREQGGQQHTPKEAQPTDDALVEDNIEKDTFDPRVVTRATEKSGIANNPDTPMEVSGEAADHRTDAPVKQDLMERDRLALLAQQEFADSLKNQALPTTDPTAIRQALAQGTDKTRAKKKHPGQIDQEKENALALGEQEVDPTGKKSIFEAIQEMEEEDKVATAEVSDRWSVGPSVAPVYFGTSGNGSPINSEFNTNSKTGNFNLSYGLNVAYEVGKKVKIRMGVHKVKYGYDTNDVAFSSSMTATSNRMFDNINYNRNSRGIVVESRSIGNSQGFLDSPSLASKEVVMNEMPVLDGKMVQQLGYIEVPLEVNYALVDKKFGVDLIGGLSSLFLVDNTVLLESRDLVTEIGEANNANSMNFSANVGMGLNYKFSPKLQLNLEPMFKYQLNTFSETAGDFHPFSVGVYSGVSFKF